MPTRHGPQAIPSDETLAAGAPSESATTASLADSARVVVQVLAPTVAGGVIKRRPRVMALAERLQLDRPAIRLLDRLRARYGERPLRVRLPGRSVSLLLDPADAGTALARTPTPFSPATLEKKAALAHFQPHGVLISGDGTRAARRALNEHVLRTVQHPGRRRLHHEIPGGERGTSCRPVAAKQLPSGLTAVARSRV